MALHIDKRPDSFEKFVGNRTMVESLQSVLERSDRSHTYLLSGPSGCGKTTLARIIAGKLECSEGDLTEINASNNRGIDTAREIMAAMQYMPMSGAVKVYIIDECHRITVDFANAILKALEDTPEHVYFILCTTEPEKLLKTVKNRCAQFAVQKLSDRQMIKFVESTITGLSKEVYARIVEVADGCPRQALVCLDQVRDLPEKKMLRGVFDAEAQKTEAIELCRALLTGKDWKKVSIILKGLEGEPESIRRLVIDYMSKAMLSGKNDQAALIFLCFKEPFYNTGKPGLIAACHEVYF